MKKQNWVWMPHAGHFICGYRCQFHLNTKVGKYIVSTVGELDWGDKEVQAIHAKIYDLFWYNKNKHLIGDTWKSAYFKRFGFEEIGLDRKYETMVFKAKKSKHKCCPWEIIVSDEVDFKGYNDADTAYKGHLKMCKKWSKV